jgi:glycosyltransferase involved in cell wall biosynthesis
MIETLPLVTVVTPSYNQGAFIAETIESVLAQTYPHLEYIIVDGASTDNTLDVIQRYAHDPRLRWISEPDRGFADALNKGFARSNGAIMGWLNSDDTYIGQPVADTVAYLMEHPEADVVYGDAVYTDAAGKPTGARQTGKPFDLIESISYRNSIPQPGSFWRRSLWEKTGPLREDFSAIIDGEYWVRASRHGVLHYVPGDRATYRLHGASKTVSESLRMWEEVKRLTDELLANTSEYSELLPHKRIITSNVAFQLSRMMLFQGNRSEAKRFSKISLINSPLRFRWIAVMALYMDTHLGTHFLDMLSNFQKGLKRRF